MIYPHLLIPSFDYVNILYRKFYFYCSSLYYSKKTSDAPFKNSNKQNLISLRGKQDVADGKRKNKNKENVRKEIYISEYFKTNSL